MQDIVIIEETDSPVPYDRIPRRSPSPESKKVQLSVTGMTCSSCVAKIERTLGRKPGMNLCMCSPSFTLRHNFI